MMRIEIAWFVDGKAARVNPIRDAIFSCIEEQNQVCDVYGIIVHPYVEPVTMFL